VTRLGSRHRLGAMVWVSAMTAFAASTQEFIFSTAPFASCHASNIVELRGGDLLASWFGGSAEGKPDVAIWASRKVAGNWSMPYELVREPNIACYNPVIFYSGDGRLWFYYKFGPHPTSWSAGRRWSQDDGKTWSPVEHLPAGLYGPIRTKPLVLPDGTIVSGTSVESYHTWACWIERSTDHGVTWTKIGPIRLALSTGRTMAPSHADPFAWQDTHGIIQPSIVRLPSGRLILYARATESIGRICMAESTDDGLTWTAARPMELPNPNSGMDAVALRDGRIVLVYNHAISGRTPLNVAVSSEGEHFRTFKVLEQGQGEFSYPSVIQGSSGDLHITYTWNRKKIRYVRVPLTDIPSHVP
jgi:predicted neuraminidase